MAPMAQGPRIGSLFSGYGGLEIGVQAVLGLPASRIERDGGSVAPSGGGNAGDRVALLPTPLATDGYKAAQNADVARARLARGVPHMTDVALGLPNFGRYAAAVQRWEQVSGQWAPSPTEPNPRTGRLRLSPRFSEWMMGLPEGWVTGIEGLSYAAQLKLIGNGVVPHQAALALRHLT